MSERHDDIRTVLIQAEKYLLTGIYPSYSGTRDADHRMALAAIRDYDEMTKKSVVKYMAIGIGIGAVGSLLVMGIIYYFAGLQQPIMSVT
jgi:hypothetical protein